MKKFDLKEHNQKYIVFAKNAARGMYPTKKSALVGSRVGIVLGILFSVIGGCGLILKCIWGMGGFLAGVLMIISNAFNLKRIGGE
ncbi:hypothetical protein [Anaerotignum sp.]|uniref:hypothetical protein n=1 Tax=Anaerotignum sp. TaxID=2039241 RepID=UPI0028A9EC65|nr:hypothetical protein [Anaerotignum sp.]